MKKKLVLVFLILYAGIELTSATISGMVTSDSSEPLTCDLFLYHGQVFTDAEMILPILTGENYVMEVYQAGSYYLKIVPHSGLYSVQYYPGVQLPGEAEALIITGNGSALSGIDFYLEEVSPGETGTLSGVLTDENGIGMSGLYVYLYGMSVNYWNNYSVVTSEHGEFVFTELYPGEYILFVDHVAGYKQYFYENADGPMQADSIIIEPGQQITGLSLELEPNPLCRISGSVYETVSGEYYPLSDVLVSGYSIDCSGSGEYFHAISDEMGNYETECRSGLYYVFATTAGYNEQYYEDADSYTEAVPLPVFEDVDDINFILEAQEYPVDNSISGNITVDGEEPGFSCTVIVVASDEDDGWSDSVISETNGYYYIDEIPAGEYYVVMFTSIAPPVYYPEGFDWQQAEEVNINGYVNGIDFELESPSSNGANLVEGHIEKQDREPVPGTSVIFFNEEGFPVSYGISDNEGHYEAASLGTGTFSVLVTKTYYYSENQEVTISGNSELDFNLVPVITEADIEHLPPVEGRLTCYPNPFIMSNSRSLMNINLYPDTAGSGRLMVFNLKGQLTAELYNGNLEAKPYRFLWDGAGSSGSAANGIYLIALEQSGRITASEKVLLIK